MEVILIGSEDMVVFIETLRDIPASGVSIESIQIKQNCQLVEGTGIKTYLDGYMDFYTPGYKTVGEEIEGFLLTSDFNYKDISGPIKDLLTDIFIAADTKIDIGAPVRKSKHLKEMRKATSFSKPVLSIVDRDLPIVMDFTTLTQVG
jgi:hypothetical protein